jgi:DNA repair photolyase
VRQPSLFAEPSLFASERAESAAGFVPLSSLAEPPGASPLTGIARLAAEAPEIDVRNDVEYHDLPCRTLLSLCDSPRVPFDYNLNPYRGCMIACSYCYARYTHDFMELRDPRDFERKIYVKRGAREALIRDLRRLDLRGKSIAIGTATDPYQPAERRFRLTRSILEVLADRRDLRLSVTTKCDLVTRDIDLLARIARQNELSVNLTITTPHYALSRRTEPRAPRPDKRLAAIRALSAAGVRAGVFLMPLMPRINDAPADLDLLVRLAAEAGASYLVVDVLFLRQCSKKRFFPFLEEEFPELLPLYRRLYASNHTKALSEYGREKRAEVQALKARYGLIGARRGDGLEVVRPAQLTLGGW